MGRLAMLSARGRGEGVDARGEWRSVRTFFLLFALDAADLIVGAKGLEVVPFVREVDGRDELLRELRRECVR